MRLVETAVDMVTLLSLEFEVKHQRQLNESTSETSPQLESLSAKAPLDKLA